VRSFLAAACIVALLSGCGGSGKASPASVVRAWSRALDAGDNDAAANLFARDAEVVQAGIVTRLHSHAEAVGWNAALPCSGKIVSLRVRGPVVTAVFLLGDRKASPCDGPGQHATAVFRIRDGKIVLWHQVPNGAQTPPPPTV